MLILQRVSTALRPLVKDDNDPNRDDTQNWIAKGQGGELGNDENAVKAGSMSAPDMSVPAKENLPSQQKMRELEEGARR